MPIPTRSTRDLQAGTEAKSKIPGARGHQRTTSTVLPDAVERVARNHLRATSLIPQQAKVGPTETSSSPSLLRRPSVRTNVTSNIRQPMNEARQASKLNGTGPVPASSATLNTSPSLKQPTIKPQFTTYQQHFSPKKAPRPASIAGEAPSSNEDATTTRDSPGAARWRDELLQLRLLHAGSKQTLQQFEKDARKKLESTSDALEKQHESIVALEQFRNRCISHTALQRWLEQGHEVNTDKLQRLAICLRDLDSLTAKEGRYSSLMRNFQAWFEHMILALGSRKQLTESTCCTLSFVEPIESLWLQEVATIQRKLQISKQILRDLSDADTGGICFVLNNYQHFANNLCQELNTCVSIHTLALEQEGAWVKHSLHRLLEGEALLLPEAVSMGRRGIWEDHATKMSLLSPPEPLL